MSLNRNMDDEDLYLDQFNVLDGWLSHEGVFGPGLEQSISVSQGRPADRQPEIVDLTSDGPVQSTQGHSHGVDQQATHHGSASRGPRFANDIINVDSLRNGTSGAVDRRSRMENDGFEIVGQRQVSPPLIPEPYRAPPTRSAANAADFDQLRMAQRSAMGSLLQRFARNIQLPLLSGFLPPSLDYRSVPFNNFGAPDVFVPDPEPPQAPRYQSPPCAPPGFTYTPAADEVYVCPNCDEELRAGESDMERQVWVVKACGHAYCGQCAQNRFVSKNKRLKTPSKTKPFKQCVVESCSSKTNGPKSMTQLFL